MATLHVLRVFTDEGGTWGNPLGVFLDGAEVPAGRRQAVAAELGYSETVFVDDRGRGTCRIFTPGSELGFAGHPSVGTAWLLAHEGEGVAALHPPAGEVAVRTAGEATFIAARAEWSPPWEMIVFGSAAEVEALDGPPGDREDEIYIWAWADEAAGHVRSRCFALEDGVGSADAGDRARPAAEDPPGPRLGARRSSARRRPRRGRRPGRARRGARVRTYVVEAPIGPQTSE